MCNTTRVWEQAPAARAGEQLLGLNNESAGYPTLKEEWSRSEDARVVIADKQCRGADMDVGTGACERCVRCGHVCGRRDLRREREQDLHVQSAQVKP
jgi:hypothetical protein